MCIIKVVSSQCRLIQVAHFNRTVRELTAVTYQNRRSEVQFRIDERTLSQRRKKKEILLEGLGGDSHQ